MASTGAETIKWSLDIVLNKFLSSVWDEVKRSEGIIPEATSRWGESGSVQGHRSSTLLSNQVFAYSRPRPWSRWKRCILNCRETLCCISVMFSTGTFLFPVSPCTRRSTGHFAEACECTSVGDSYLSKHCWKKRLFLIRSVCGLQNRDSNLSISEQKYTKSISAIYDAILIQLA